MHPWTSVNVFHGVWFSVLRVMRPWTSVNLFDEVWFSVFWVICTWTSTAVLWGLVQCLLSYVPLDKCKYFFLRFGSVSLSCVSLDKCTYFCGVWFCVFRGVCPWTSITVFVGFESVSAELCALGQVWKFFVGFDSVSYELCCLWQV